MDEEFASAHKALVEEISEDDLMAKLLKEKPLNYYVVDEDTSIRTEWR